MAQTERLAQLRDNLVRHLDLEELCTLCFDQSLSPRSLAEAIQHRLRRQE
jgi:hypothetical protein